MRIESVPGDIGYAKGKTVNSNKTISFSDTMSKQLEDVNELQIQSEKASEALALGDLDNIHEVMIKTEEAKLALEMTVQIRNKVVEAYQEIMKMQI